MTTVFQSVSAFRAWRQKAPAGASLGFVPTMGGLHAGHLSLARRAQAENDAVAVSLFLNRPQFDKVEDFERYPADFEEDVAALRVLGVQAVFAPSHDELYSDGYRYRVSENDFSKELEGAHRAGHFDGVLTVVLKLFGAVAPDRAYFGEKDWQQLQLVRGMAEAFFLPVTIVACPTQRDSDGLALSSRNRRLSVKDRELAGSFNRILRAAATAEQAASALEAAGFSVDYVADRDGRRLGAVVLGGVRLIDNLPLSELGAPGGAGSAKAPLIESMSLSREAR